MTSRIDYRKSNAATRKDHFSLPFLDQILERLAKHSFYCFLNEYSNYTEISIVPKDEEKTTFTCPFSTYAFRRMSFELCNAPTTFQRYMMSIFSYLVKQCMRIFMDDFYVFGSSFKDCLSEQSAKKMWGEKSNSKLGETPFLVKKGDSLRPCYF